jgi:uncharacterized protein YjbI with pentapeptide repeats
MLGQEFPGHQNLEDLNLEDRHLNLEDQNLEELNLEDRHLNLEDLNLEDLNGILFSLKRERLKLKDQEFQEAILILIIQDRRFLERTQD